MNTLLPRSQRLASSLSASVQARATAIIMVLMLWGTLSCSTESNGPSSALRSQPSHVFSHPSQDGDPSSSSQPGSQPALPPSAPPAHSGAAETLRVYAERVPLNTYALQLYTPEGPDQHQRLELSELLHTYGQEPVHTGHSLTLSSSGALALTGLALPWQNSILTPPWVQRALQSLLRTQKHLLGWLALGSSAILTISYLAIQDDESSPLLDDSSTLLSSFTQDPSFSSAKDHNRPNPPPFVPVIVSVKDTPFENTIQQESDSVFISKQDQRALQMLETVLKRYHASSDPEFLRKLGKQTLSYYLHYLDVSKSFFLQKDVDIIHSLFAERFLENVIHRRDFISLITINRIRNRRIQEAMHYLRSLQTPHPADPNTPDTVKSTDSADIPALPKDTTLTRAFGDYAQTTEEWKERLRDKDAFSRLLLTKIFGAELDSQNANPKDFMLLGQMYNPPSYGPVVIDVLVQSVFRNFGHFSRWDGKFFKWDPWSRGSGVRFYVDDDFAFSLSPHEGIFTVQDVNTQFIQNQGILKAGDRVVGMRLNEDNSSYVSLYPFPNIFSELFSLRKIIDHKSHLRQNKAGDILYYLYVLRHDPQQDRYYILELPIPYRESLKKQSLAKQKKRERIHKILNSSNVTIDGHPKTIIYVKPPILDASYYLHGYQKRRWLQAGRKRNTELATLRAESDLIEYQGWFDTAQEQYENLQLDGVIIDLRGNYGDLFALAPQVLAPFMRYYALRLRNAEFAPAHTASRFQQWRKNLRQLFTQPSSPVGRTMFAYDGPVLLLVDRHTSGVAEFLVQEFKASGRGIVVGTSSHTLGDGTINRFYTVDDRNRLLSQAASSSLCLTVYRCYASNGSSVPASGVLPDIVIPSISSVYEYRHDEAQPTPVFPDPSPDSIEPLPVHYHDLWPQNIVNTLRHMSEFLINDSPIMSKIKTWTEQYQDPPVKYISLSAEEWRYLDSRSLKYSKTAESPTDSMSLQWRQPPPQEGQGDVILYHSTHLLARYHNLLQQHDAYDRRPRSSAVRRAVLNRRIPR